MRFFFSPHSLLDRLRAFLPNEVLRTARGISTARVFLSVTSLIAIYLDPTEPTRYAEVAYASLSLYVVYSVAVFLVIRIRATLDPRVQVVLHGIDLAWAASIMLFTEGPNSPFYLFFLFVLLAAAYRWGLRETVLTAVTVTLILVAQALFVRLDPRDLLQLPTDAFPLNRLIMRSAYIAVMAFLLGYLAEEEKYQRAEASALSFWIANIRAENGLRNNLQFVLDGVLRVFGARSAVLVATETGTDQVFVWEAVSSGTGELPTLRLKEPEPAQRPAYSAVTALGASLLRRAGAGPAVTIVSLDESSQKRESVQNFVAEAFFELHPCRECLCASFSIGVGWSGRFLLLDPLPTGNPVRDLQFLQKILREVAPALYGVYLIRRLRSRAGAAERSRVARELHDGAIQSLVGTEMKIDVLRRKLAEESPPLAEELERVQKLVHNEVLNLREMMNQIRPVEVGPGDLLDTLASVVERFGRETGIEVRFESELEDAEVAPRVGRELVRILQEALVNVRRHSGAGHVMVRFGASGGRWELGIDDDGQGFDFSGQRDLAALDAKRAGPAVIRERVRLLGGQLTIQSNPGAGSRLEIHLPQRSHG